MSIINTTEQMNENPLLGIVMGMERGGIGAAIEGQESAGQRQLVNSAQLPAKGILEVEPMGVKVIGPSAGDPIFVDVELPEGWSKKSTDHAMWSDLLDKQGRKRAGIFYKAAFYDRSAHINASRRYTASSRPVGGYTEKYEPHAPYEGYVVDNGTGATLWVSDPFECDKAQSWKCHEDSSNAATAWLTEHFPDYANVMAYWDN